MSHTENIFAFTYLKITFFLILRFHLQRNVMQCLIRVKCIKIKSMTQDYKDVEVETTATQSYSIHRYITYLPRYIKRPQNMPASDMLSDKFFIDLYL